jgi:hypothetical protein
VPGSRPIGSGQTWLGVQNDVLVIEGETVTFDPTGFDLGGGESFERYYFVRGYGRVRERGMSDPDCNSGAPQNCNGIFSACTPGETTFNRIYPWDFTFDHLVPVTATPGWW